MTSETLKIAVLMGGSSAERDVSLASGAQVTRALRALGHEVVCLDPASGVMSADEVVRLTQDAVPPEPPPPGAKDLLTRGELPSLLRTLGEEGTELIFPALHGGSGEDGTLQAILDLAGLPYVGSGRVACTLAMDKEVSKRLFRDGGVATPDWLCGPASLDEVERVLGLPVIVKPPSGGSTLGLTLAHDREELSRAVEESLRYEDRILFERFIGGRELTVGIVDDRPLPVGEIIPEHEIFDYECKYQPGMAEEIFPADIPDALATRLQEEALKVHRLLFLRDFSRVDFIVDDRGEAWCLEANALPGLTENSLVPKAAAAAGISLEALCERIVAASLNRTHPPGTTRSPAG